MALHTNSADGVCFFRFSMSMKLPYVKYSMGKGTTYGIINFPAHGLEILKKKR